MPVVRDWRGRENRASIKNRQDLLLASLDITAPELKVPAILFLPVFIEIKKEIQTPIQPVGRMVRKIHMNAEFAAAFDHMQATSHEFRVGNKLGDPRKLF